MAVHLDRHPLLHLEQGAEQCGRSEAIPQCGGGDGRGLLAAHRLADALGGHAGQGAHPGRLGDDAER